MLAEIDTESYDVRGKPVAEIRRRHRLAGPNVPFGRFFSQPLTLPIENLKGICDFLRTCRYVSDREQFGKPDYWVSPEHFERLRRGDCEDFALWVWRQLVDLGYECRFVGGFYRRGHAWLTLTINGKAYLLEPQACWSEKLPRLSVLRYQPSFSVEWTGTKPRFFEHVPTKPLSGFCTYVQLFPEWLAYQLRRAGRSFTPIVLRVVSVARRVYR